MSSYTAPKAGQALGLSADAVRRLAECHCIRVKDTHGGPPRYRGKDVDRLAAAENLVVTEPVLAVRFGAPEGPSVDGDVVGWDDTWDTDLQLRAMQGFWRLRERQVLDRTDIMLGLVAGYCVSAVRLTGQTERFGDRVRFEAAADPHLEARYKNRWLRSGPGWVAKIIKPTDEQGLMHQTCG